MPRYGGLVQVVAVALLPLTLLGCPDSSGIATADIRAEINIQVTEDTAKVEASLFEGDSSFSLELVDGDRLVASADGAAQLALEGDTTTYRSDLPLDVNELRVELLRDSGDNAFMTEQVPEPAMLDTKTFSLADDPITITWSNPIEGGYVAIFVDNCATISFETPESKEPVSDTGSYTISRAEMEAEGSDDCATLVIARSRTHRATEAEHFESTSYIRADSWQRTKVVLTP